MRLRGALLLTLPLLLLSCRTAGPPEPQVPPPRAVAFQPADYVVPIRLAEGRYSDLFAANSYAVWVGPEVSALKRDQAVQEGQTVDPALDSDAAHISGNYLLVECHLQSVFADMSIAYDVVGLRGMDVYLRMPDGRTLKPVQELIGISLAEEQQGALRRFGRTNIMVFPKRDMWIKTVPEKTDYAVELVIEGYGSVFQFVWPGGPAGPPEQWAPTVQETRQAIQLSFANLYARVKQAVHTFD